MFELQMVMHQSIPAMSSSTPSPPTSPARADPRALAFFWSWMANSQGWGLLGCQIPWGGDEEKGKCPVLSQVVPF